MISAMYMRLVGTSKLPLLVATSLVIGFVLAILQRIISPLRAMDDIFASSEVTAAPLPSLSTNSSSEFADSRGAYHKLVFPGLTSNAEYVNVIFTKAGTYRSGDLHKCDQINLIVSGSATLKTIRSERTTTREVKSGDLIVTPAGVPHLYYFSEDTLLTEYWINVADGGKLCPFRAWFYKPFRDIVDANMAAPGSV